MLPIMVGSSRMDKRAPVLSGLLALLAAPAAAGTLQVDVERVDTAMATLEDVSVELAWADASASGELRVGARVLKVADTGYVFAEPRWRCTLQREDTGGWHCAGKATAKAGEATLALSADGAGVDASFARGKARLALTYPFEGTTLPVEAHALPAEWLQPLLAGAWPQARFTGGTLDADLQVDRSVADTLAIAGTVSSDGLGLDTQDGLVAAAGLGVNGPVTVRMGKATHVEFDLALAGGELLAGPVYAALPAAGASFALTAAGDGERWTLSRMDWRDRDALRVQGSAMLDLGADPALRELQVQATSADLALAHERYLASLLATLGLDGLALSGGAEATVVLSAGELQSAVLDLHAVDAVDGGARFALSAAQGRVGWQRSGSIEGELRWRDAALYDIPLGTAAMQWRSVDGGLALRQPAVVPVLGGTLTLQRLAWIPGDAPGGEPELSLSLALADVGLADLSRRFDWPEFGGTLSGRIPSAHYEGGVLTLEGGLDIGVFDGRIEIGTLTLERPFGVAPTLGADIGIAGLDLVPLTEAFGFGRISGRLDGRVGGLRLVDWQPVAFDAALYTSTSAKDKRRISQRAVSDLSSVGGGGIAGGIQQQVMRMFETFPYERIGLSCRLDNNVCTMGGVPGSDSSAGGYTIVEGSGLPRITVVGHQRRVDWPVLVSRLQAATAGQGPVVD